MNYHPIRKEETFKRSSRNIKLLTIGLTITGVIFTIFYWIMVAGPKRKLSTSLQWDSVNPFIGFATVVCASCKGSAPCCAGSALIFTLMSANLNITIFDGQKTFS